MTIKDVAARAGVSYQTVSRAVNHPEEVTAGTLERVRTAIAELDWTPNAMARGLRAGQSG